MEDAAIEIERLEARLRAAEDVCVLFAWSPSRMETAPEKAAHELWSRWVEISGNDCTPEKNPHLTDEYVAELAAKRDEIRARTLAKIAELMPEIAPAKHVDK